MYVRYFFIALTLLISPAVYAGEIQHHSIIDVFGDAADVLSHTPSGDTTYRCSLEQGDCVEHNDDTRPLLPTLGGAPFAEVSRTGKIGVLQTSLMLGTQQTTFYSLYDLTGNTPTFIGLFSVNGSVVKTVFSPNESVYFAITDTGMVARYNTATKQSTFTTLDQRSLPFLSISHRGTYLSAYNYIEEEHRIWNTKTGTRMEVPGAPGVVEFSENEREVAFVVDENGYRNLSRMDLQNSDVHPVAHGPFLVEDYVYLKNKLYYLANKQTPLTWSLYATETADPIAENISYNTYLTRYGNVLVYGKIDEKNIDLYVFDGATHRRIDAAPVAQRAYGLVRNEETIRNRTTAIVMPEDIRSGDLYIWLHGGPRRQTSLGYHPYLSYAVYDELLEDIAAAGNYVVKLDYSGSWGYGSDFIDTLKDNVGIVEINDVENVIDTFTRKHRVRDVYLIGNSYGGYMAFRGLNALTHKVDGVISINGVADWYTLVQGIPSSPFKDLFGGIPSLDTLERYLAASAFKNYEDIDDQPMLVIYGNEDKTVPANQSKQYAEFMEAHDKNVTLLELTGAEHTITRRENLNTMCTAIRDVFTIKKLTCS